MALIDDFWRILRAGFESLKAGTEPTVVVSADSVLDVAEVTDQGWLATCVNSAEWLDTANLALTKGPVLLIPDLSRGSDPKTLAIQLWEQVLPVPPTRDSDVLAVVLPTSQLRSSGGEGFRRAFRVDFRTFEASRQTVLALGAGS